MAAYAPTKTYSRAVSANLEFQRQLDVAQSALETKKRHARGDLNGQIITLRETLFNIRARTPTIVQDEVELSDNGRSGSPRGLPARRSSAVGAASNGGNIAHRRPSASSTGRRVSTVGPVVADHAIGTGAVYDEQTGETLIASQNGLIATGITGREAFNSTLQRPSTARKVLRVSLGVPQNIQHGDRRASSSMVLTPEGGDGTPRIKPRIGVRLVPTKHRVLPNQPQSAVESQRNDSTDAADRPTSQTGQSESRRPSQTPNTMGVRRVVFSAHVRRRSSHRSRASSSDVDSSIVDDNDDDESQLNSTCSSVRPIQRPQTVGDGSFKMSNSNLHNSSSNVGSKSLVIFPRTSSRASSNATGASSIIKPVHQNSITSATEHPSIKVDNNRQQKGHPRNNKVDKPDDKGSPGVISSKPKSFYLVRNPFFKLDASTEKRIEQVESIRISLSDIYHKRQEKAESDLQDNKSGSLLDLTLGEKVSRLPLYPSHNSARTAGNTPQQREGSLSTSPVNNIRNLANNSHQKATKLSTNNMATKNFRNMAHNTTLDSSHSRPSSRSSRVETRPSSRSSRVDSSSTKPALTTVKVKLKVTPSVNGAFRRYTVHQTQKLSVPGVSSNQLKDLERFHLLMTRKTLLHRNSSISS